MVVLRLLLVALSLALGVMSAEESARSFGRRAAKAEKAGHIAEAIFKAAARALRVAVEKDPRQSGIPSTKGTLTQG